jgi:hypothetical protein
MAAARIEWSHVGGCFVALPKGGVIEISYFIGGWLLEVSRLDGRGHMLLHSEACESIEAAKEKARRHVPIRPLQLPRLARK